MMLMTFSLASIRSLSRLPITEAKVDWWMRMSMFQLQTFPPQKIGSMICMKKQFEDSTDKKSSSLSMLTKTVLSNQETSLNKEIAL
jgi:hypothetical protein